MWRSKQNGPRKLWRGVEIKENKNPSPWIFFLYNHYIPGQFLVWAQQNSPTAHWHLMNSWLLVCFLATEVKPWKSDTTLLSVISGLSVYSPFLSCLLNCLTWGCFSLSFFSSANDLLYKISFLPSLFHPSKWDLEKRKRKKSMQMKARLHTHTQILLRIFISSNPQDKNTSTRSFWNKKCSQKLSEIYKDQLQICKITEILTNGTQLTHFLSRLAPLSVSSSISDSVSDDDT